MNGGDCRTRINTARALGAAAMSLLVLLAASGSASAGPPGAWSKVTGPDQNYLEIGVARTGGGTLHVLWTKGKSVLNTRISADAKTVSAPSTVFTYGDAVNNDVALIAAPGGLRAFFAGLYNHHPLDSVLATATSTNGTSWSVQPTPASDGTTGNRSPVYVAAGIGGAIEKNGVPISIWGDSGGGAAGYHEGLSSSDPDVHFGGSSATVDGPNAAVDSVTGQVAIAWNDIDSARVLVQSVSPAGGRLKTPGGQAPDGLERVAMTGRQGAAGIYVAYLNGTNSFTSRPAIWRVGAANGMVLSNVTGARFMGVASAPQGRLWAFWMRKSPALQIFAARSNPAATAFGAIVTLKPPVGMNVGYSLEGEGSRGPLDLLALVASSSSNIANWHQRVLPGLSLKATGGKGKATFKVTDVGAPVSGATVSFAGKSKTTGPKGKVTISAKPGKRTATATKAGYTKATRNVTVK
jgi:hypothetical protein